MTTRSGGRYRVRSGGAPVLVERTGHKPEAEAQPAKAPKSSGESKAAPSKETPDESADQ